MKQLVITATFARDVTESEAIEMLLTTKLTSTREVAVSIMNAADIPEVPTSVVSNNRPEVDVAGYDPDGQAKNRFESRFFDPKRSA